MLYNMKIANINPQEIDKIIISHSDWDHIGSLPFLLNHGKGRERKFGKKFEVYVPKSFSINLKNEIKRYAKVVEVSNALKIQENIWTTGELGEQVKEQSLVINTDKGNVIITGCAHAGLDKIIQKSREFGEVYAVMGGFHDVDSESINSLKGVPLVVPCHCTEKVEEIKKQFPESYRDCYVGLLFELNE